jgi:hypothetical protein
MPDHRVRTPLHFAVAACFLALVSPVRFLRFQERTTRGLGIPAAADETSAFAVRRAFWLALLLVAVAAGIGAAVGRLGGHVFGLASAHAILTLQIVGASVLLWGTLFVRGWEIQTGHGETLIERVNQWLYRLLYCAGTGLLVASLTWPQR